MTSIIGGLVQTLVRIIAIRKKYLDILFLLSPVILLWIFEENYHDAEIIEVP